MNHQFPSLAPVSTTPTDLGVAVPAAGRPGAGPREVVVYRSLRGGPDEAFAVPCAYRAAGDAGRVLPVRGRRVAGRDVQRVRQVDRRPLVGRPAGASVRYDRVRVAPRRRAHVPSPAVRVERAQVGFATLAIAALVTALFVIAVLLLTQWRAGAPASGSPVSHSLSELPQIEQVSPLSSPL